MLLDERTASTYRNQVVQIHTEDQEDALGTALIFDQRVMASYHGVLGTICTCRAWSRGVAKYLAVFDTSRDELRELVSWESKARFMNNVQLGCRTWCTSSRMYREEFLEFLDDHCVDGVCLEAVHLGCIENCGTSPGAEDLLNKLRGAYDELEDNVFDSGSKQSDFGISDFEGQFVVSFFDVVSGEAVGRIAGESLLITVIEPGHCMVSADCSITGSVDAICVTGRSLVNGALDPGFP